MPIFGLIAPFGVGALALLKSFWKMKISLRLKIIGLILHDAFRRFKKIKFILDAHLRVNKV